MTFELALLWAFIAFIVIIIGTFAYGGISAAPWVPLWKRDVQRMLELAEVKPGETLFDLGAGDGRIVIAAANKHGAKATGFEIATLPYFFGYIRILMSGAGAKGARLSYRNFFKQDFSEADVICAFLTPAAMAKLKPKFEKETKPGCRIVSYVFSVPDWEPTLVDKPDDKTASIYLYKR